jgi:hypothetical protein
MNEPENREAVAANQSATAASRLFFLLVRFLRAHARSYVLSSLRDSTDEA